MHRSALVFCIRKHFSYRFQQSRALVPDDEFYTGQATPTKQRKEADPAGFVRSHPLCGTRNLTKPSLFTAIATLMATFSYPQPRLRRRQMPSAQTYGYCLPCKGRFRLFLRQLVRRFFRTAADQFPDLPLIISSFSCIIFSDIVCCLLSECVCCNFILPESANYVFFCAFFNLRNLLYLIACRRFS